MANILVHSCYNPSFQDRPVVCGCNWWVSWKETEALLAVGEVVRGKRTIRGNEYIDYQSVVLVGKLLAWRCDPSITDEHIIKASVEGNKYHQERIEVHGTMTQLMFAELGAELVCSLRQVRA